MQVLNESAMKFVVAGALAFFAGRYVAPIVGGFVKNNLLTGGAMVLIGAFLVSMDGSLIKGVGAGVVIAGVTIVLAELLGSK